MTFVSNVYESELKWSATMLQLKIKSTKVAGNVGKSLRNIDT